MDNDYKAIRLLGFFSLFLSVVFLATWVWYRFTAGPSTGATLAQLMWLVLGLLGVLATKVASILDAQADEIADLRRRLAERPGGLAPV